MASGSGILDPAAPCHQISFKRQNFFLERAGSQDEIFIMGGTNDLLCGIRLSSLEKNMERGISHIAASLPLTIGIPPQVTRASLRQDGSRNFPMMPIRKITGRIFPS